MEKLTSGKIIAQHRNAQGMNRAQLARALSEKISRTISRASVSQWEKNKRAPAKDLLLLIAMRYTDWRQDMALECLSVLDPELYAPIEEAWGTS